MISGAAIPIPSCGLRYAAAADGAIYSLVNPSRPRRVFGTLCADGYRRVQIRFVDGSKKMMAVHRLVAEVHCPNPEQLPEVNHIDGRKDRNIALNLEWVTRAQNIRHAVETGLHRTAPAHRLANKESVGALRALGLTLQAIADQLGCGLATAHRYASEGASA